ncbi:MAG: MiaB/RimO family radical SAM methylthiotransferase [Chloroherpetonaceae bacterium]|nr:MiaB/RimO family radical SAM methylthiotransferase [Chthonomonadaceae bacterium]MDW8208182.1 MiaB/RimO family radical SAM methylthiotransferase [Chloroherpetonaceae bacterium]
MPRAAFTTLGCKVNQYETQRILDDFEARGFTITEFTEPADIYVVNTCSVTQAAERKSRQIVRKIARQNPDAIVVMTGCYGEMARIKGEAIEEAALIVPNHQKMDTLAHVLRTFPHLAQDLPATPPEQVLRNRAVRRTRATIKVQDGCNVFCAFCSIPYTRPYMRSRPLDEVIAEAERYAAEGYREIVVTGVLVGAYGQDGFQPQPGHALPRLPAPEPHPHQPDLPALLLRLAQVPGIERVRLSSIEPTQVTDRLIDAFASEPRLCPHLHIPLQSGDTGVLRAMNRPYDQQFYLERCWTARKRIPDLAITTDIMVGFPGEDRAAFENTCAVVREVGFARAHLFRYSPRPNTPAATMGNQVPDLEKEERSRALAELCRQTQQQFIRRFLGRTLPVLVEGRTDRISAETVDTSDNVPHTVAPSHPGALPSQTPAALLTGYTGNYIRVQFTGGSHLIGRIVPVHLIEPTSDGAIGEVGGVHAVLDDPLTVDVIPLATRE